MKNLWKLVPAVILTVSFFFYDYSISTSWSQEGSTSSKSSVSKAQGAQLWGQNCVRCHNIRPPASYSDREWDIIVHHMRVRANLTAEEYELIREFLKSAN